MELREKQRIHVVLGRGRGMPRPENPNTNLQRSSRFLGIGPETIKKSVNHKKIEKRNHNNAVL